MAAAAIAILFLAMLAAPYVIALKSTGNWDVPDPIDLPEAPEVEVPATPLVKEQGAMSLAQLAEVAEQQAAAAEDLARETHWAALAAAARAARLRAEAAAVAAEDAFRFVQQARVRAGNNFDRSLDDPQARPGRRAA